MVQNGVTNGFRGKETIKLSQELNELLNLSIQDREIPKKKSP
ncbi:aspartyl-phosphate phosphatase Spo0E family protein [Sutcliffiella cohnii]|nr:aspartyl-phosphate phosphatase Spo0E family protein [Sutcliffiella cohnii]